MIAMFVRVEIVDIQHPYCGRRGRMIWVNGDSASFDVLLEDVQEGEISSPKCRYLLGEQLKVIKEK